VVFAGIDGRLFSTNSVGDFPKIVGPIMLRLEAEVAGLHLPREMHE